MTIENITNKQLVPLGFGEVPIPAVKKPTNRITRIIQTIIEFFKRLFHLNSPLPSTSLLNSKISNIQNDPHNVGEWIAGNDVLPTASAEETTKWKIDLIKSAKQTIEISGNICGGKVFRETLKAIEDRIKECPDLKVKLLLSDVLLEGEDTKYLKLLEKTYPTNISILVTGFYMHGLRRLENHVKVVVIDEKYAIVGGTNIQDRLTREAEPGAKAPGIVNRILGHGSCDMDVMLKGPMAKTLRREFYKLYSMHEVYMKKTSTFKNHFVPLDASKEIATLAAFDENPNLTKNVKIKALVGGWENKRNMITEEYAKIIKKADKSITFAHMYFHPHNTILNSIDDAVKRDIPITVVTAGKSSSAPVANHVYSYANSLNYFRILNNHPKNKVCEYDYDKKSNGKNIYHKKVAVIQRKNKEALTMIGSYNLGGLSHYLHELNLVIKSDKVANQVLEVIKRDEKKSKEVTLRQAKSYHRISPKTLFSKFERVFFPVLFD